MRPTFASPAARPAVLLVDDDALFSDAIADILRARGYEVRSCRSIADATREGLGGYRWALVDDQLPDGSGLELVAAMARHGTRTVLVSAFPHSDAAIRATHGDRWAYLPKPLDVSRLLHLLDHGTAASLGDERAAEPMLPSLQKRHHQLEKLAGSACPVLVTGETGTGKGHLAAVLHRMSARSGRFVTVNCAAIPKELFEAELFGAEKGAYTGALGHPGLVEAASGGTLFLDEVGELPLALQAKLLSFLDSGIARRVGSTSERSVSVRIVAATNCDLPAACELGTFRLDLFHRLDVARIELDPLRDRTDDIAMLCDGELVRLGQRDGREYRLAAGERERLEALPWPGNIRELSNAIQRSTLVCPPLALSPTLTFRRSPEPPRAALPIVAPEPADGAPESHDLRLATVEKRHVLDVLKRAGGNRAKAATWLGIGVATLRRKLTQWEEGDR